MASRTLSFPPRPAVDTPAETPSACTIVPFPAPKVIAVPLEPEPTLHLVTEATPRRNRVSPRRVDTTARARAIVAQVEWEIEQQAARYRAATFFRRYKLGAARPPAEPILEMILAPGFDRREPSFERETPLVVLRRVVRTLRQAVSR